MKWEDLIKELDKMENWKYEVFDSSMNICNPSGGKTYCKFEAIEAHDFNSIIDQCNKGGKLPFEAYPDGYDYRYQKRDQGENVQHKPADLV
mgnify:FL=1|tara:strand:- start:3414 stop:3686 length:273 start_codon:yes stop_codon:yes gene_type:complete